MFYRSICWFTCIFVAVVIASDYNDTDVITGFDSPVTVNHLRTSSTELPTTERELAHQQPSVTPQTPVAAEHGSPGVKYVCGQQVVGQLSVENAAAAAVLALRHSCSSLKQAAVAFIKAHTHQVVTTQGWADATVSHPHSVVELTRLLAEPPAETSTAATPGGRPTTGSQPHGDRGRTPYVAALPTANHHTPPPDDATISHMRNFSRQDKNRLLIKAAMVGATADLRALLAAGADVRARDEAWQGWTALHWTADRGHVEAARLLLEAGAEVRARTRQDSTVLHLAASSGHAAVVQLFTDSTMYSVNPNAVDISSQTPLHCAASWGRAEAAFALLVAGADRDATDASDLTPLDIAVKRNRQEVVQMLLPR
ncbi:ankyrin repeat and protein kinase domain-containing protein 1-like isoform X1 [Schistocerca cancellata]|uniref:ankyrin repeat and protein kinase domain-containing protein 1-like isoform X1 n=1 Tax=Schistocerca cancellata TaxID=274614 RepID=UPI002118BDA2|nr:ankyrin repeat and protein kinase domain-containing protein 1-like isoform X1 [Schistocerca cancellata]XP_049769608.1 ankyrin repeat and protein kinase domain-containing protein 1-like isoform X1 [Schistocerca cancellata]